MNGFGKGRRRKAATVGKCYRRLSTEKLINYRESRRRKSISHFQGYRLVQALLESNAWLVNIIEITLNQAMAHQSSMETKTFHFHFAFCFSLFPVHSCFLFPLKASLSVRTKRLK